jgi:hypothetical protein
MHPGIPPGSATGIRHLSINSALGDRHSLINKFLLQIQMCTHGHQPSIEQFTDLIPFSSLTSKVVDLDNSTVRHCLDSLNIASLPALPPPLSWRLATGINTMEAHSAPNTTSKEFDDILSRVELNENEKKIYKK